ncbi:molybdenum cofactor guanylyltransferase [Paeniglutamicibacter cryotolerans]|uniref:Molybdopterin-guanine dinucleotide biosynthesis protein A n=1 Tax=Paeniglutamicibacter cryotolerans TaxID=670079 RepID=A0A839QHR0_9MICC|nr:NTP transferase domain-containing protein [Paeniglutamicibacter cryotolerans]MBB2995420.1 molybdopterin-guanine dinucleotide biosynthesis protein A [Paeniglutamicibacter cryotolerans]
MSFDAIIVAGGRGSRLGGVAKPLLTRNGRSLLACALDAVAGAEHIVVVGTPELNAVVDGYAVGAPAGQRVLVTREDPAYGGPAAAVAAGRQALDALPGDVEKAAVHTVVIAADLLEPGLLVTAVLAAAVNSGSDAGSTAWVPVDGEGRLQPLGCVIGTNALRAAIADASAVAGTLENASMMRLLATVQIERLKLKDLDFSDIDTPADVGRYGIDMPVKD